MIDASSPGNPFLEKDLLIGAPRPPSRNEELVAKLAQSEWDLVDLSDEAHKMSGAQLRQRGEETNVRARRALRARSPRHLR